MRAPNQPPRHVLITGASSGLGAALAAAYAGRGARLTLLGRDPGRLKAVAAACGPAATPITAEVTDRAAMADAIAQAHARMPLDLLIANAGVSGLTAEGGIERIFAVNLDGLRNTILPAIPLMRARGSGQLALMSSLASFRGTAQAAAYCASKAAVRVWGEGLRPQLRPHGIRVSVVCPGFVKTPLTARNPFPMPFLMQPETAAGIIARGLARDRARIAFPWRLYMMARLAAALPAGVVDGVLGRYAGKE